MAEQRVEDGTGFSYSGAELEALADAKNYYRWILSYLSPYLKGSVVEVGAGIGTFASHLLASPEIGPNIDRLTLLEPADNLFHHLIRRFPPSDAGPPAGGTDQAANGSDRRVRPVQAYFGDADLGGSVDSIVLVNVLEHIEDDAAFAAAAIEALRGGGTLLIFVPALQWLYGTLDAELEHFRRYTRQTLTQLLQEAGFTVELTRYMNLLGVASWFLAGKIVRSRTIHPRDIAFYDRCVIPWVSRLESWVAPPFGQNVMAIARKTR